MTRAASQTPIKIEIYLLTAANSYLLNPNSIHDTLLEAMGGLQFNEKQLKQ